MSGSGKKVYVMLGDGVRRLACRLVLKYARM